MGDPLVEAAHVRENDSISELSAKAKSISEVIVRGERVNLEHALQLGATLCLLKKKMKHGQWLPKLREIGVSTSRAYVFMNLAKLPAQEISNCSSIRQAEKEFNIPENEEEELGEEGLPDLPKDVANALADTWHLECARLLSKMTKECKAAFSWSSWLDGSVLDALKSAEQCFLAAAPRKVCPDCKGQKKIGKDPCQRCRHGGYLGAQT